MPRSIIPVAKNQISIWDIPVTKTPEKITKIEVLDTKNTDLDTKTIKSATEIKEILQVQQRVIDKYKADPRLNRIIHYCGGGVGIELEDEKNFKTIYVNLKGKEEFSYNKRSSMIYLDKVIWIKDQQQATEKPLDIKKVKVGDIVEAQYGNDIIDGKIINEYGLNNWILNIVFDNGKKHTAIGRQAITKILKCA